MSGKRLFAIFLIFVLASAAWMVLAGSVQVRTNDMDGRLGDAVTGLWGSPQRQEAPSFSAKWPGDSKRKALELAGTDATAGFRLDQRRKGLLWYSTYVVDFAAKYRVANPATDTASASMTFRFPDAAGSYDGFDVRVDGVAAPVTYSDGAAFATFDVPAGGTVVVETGYRANGMDSWSYSPSPQGASVIRDFRLAMETDFEKVDYPAEGVSPTSVERTGPGWTLAWDYDSVVSGREIGLVMPTPLNPGPLVGRITFFAPVSLLFFFAALILLTATSEVNLHPMHYGFLTAAFFAYHLLLAYLADQVDVNLAFAIASVVSVALVVGYLRVVVGTNKILAQIAASQVLFLVLFSYSFFFEGITGLAITIGAVLTLAYFMARTAGLDWERVFPKRVPVTAAQWVPAPMPTPAQAPTVPDPYGSTSSAETNEGL